MSLGVSIGVNIGLPRETKPFESRVALTPAAAGQLIQKKHSVWMESKAGIHSGFSDKEYQQVGVKILSSKKEVYQKADLILKVKEPQPVEYSLFRPGLMIFTFLHLAANPRLASELKKKKVKAFAYEEVQDNEGRLPILAPMSEIAGLLTPLIGANYLRRDLGGKGTLLPAVGSGGTGHVTILGAGQVGSNALRTAHGLGASVTVYDVNPNSLERLKSRYSERLELVHDAKELPEILRRTDLLIGAVLVKGQRAPRVVTKSMVTLMEKGSVVMDVAVDQGGCIETIRPTDLKKPIYTWNGILHYGVTNIPSLVPRTASEVLSRASLPYLFKLIDRPSSLC